MDYCAPEVREWTLGELDVSPRRAGPRPPPAAPATPLRTLAAWRGPRKRRARRLPRHATRRPGRKSSPTPAPVGAGRGSTGNGELDHGGREESCTRRRRVGESPDTPSVPGPGPEPADG